jgi:YVTN family beta-propeller protein
VNTIAAPRTTLRGRSRLRAWLIVVLGVFLIGSTPLLVGTTAHAATAATSSSDGVVLPSGRLVTPAGSPYDAQRQSGDASYDQGDFPLGLALSPDGKIAVTTLNGQGFGAPYASLTMCNQNSDAGTTTKNSPECPGTPDRLKGSPQVTSPDEGIDVTDLATGKVVQKTVVPTSNHPPAPYTCNDGFNCNGIGLAFSPDGANLYVTGGGACSTTTNTCDIYDYPVSLGTTTDTLGAAKVVTFPSLVATVTQNQSLPVTGVTAGYPRAMKVTPDGKTLLVADEFDSTLEAFDIAGGQTPTLEAQGLMPGALPAPVAVAYLYDMAISPNGEYAYVTAEGDGTVYVVNIAAFLAAGPLTSTLASKATPLLPTVAIPVPVTGLDHPTGITVSPNGNTLYVTSTNSDQLAVLPLLDGLPVGVALGVTPRTAVTGTLVDLHAVDNRPTGDLGSAPDAVAVDQSGTHAYVALAGDDAVAVVDTATETVAGYVPTGWYPTDVAVGPTDRRIYELSAKGLGSRYVAGVGGYTPAPGTSLPSGASVPDGSYYDAANMPGLLTRFAPPTAVRLASYTVTAANDILHAGGLDQRTSDNPIPAVMGGSSPITHVVYIVRENRTFDQVFGDLALKRADVDADPSLQLLAPATPNAHAIAGRYAISDNFFSDGEASVQGHWWSSSANVDDYVEKDWRQNYSPRGMPYDPALVPVTTPPGCSIFQAMQKKTLTDPGFTFFNYGELVGSVAPSTSATTPASQVCNGVGVPGAQTAPTLDPNYPTQLELTPDDRTRAAEFLKNSGLTLNGTSTGVKTNTLRNFNYLIMSEDHTSGLSGTVTPRAQVAQNDAGVGEIISALSKSSYWSSTAVFVEEDDSQDGLDHVDGHRNVLLVASPYAKQISGDGCLPGYIGHAHYDQSSVLRTVELILDVPSISAYDAGATPLYDLFQDKDSASQLTASDLAPFQVAPAPSFIDETVASLPKTQQNAALEAYSKTLDTTHVDAAEAADEYLLWATTMKTTVPQALAQGVALKGAAEDKASGPELDLPATISGVPLEDTSGAAPVFSTVTGKEIAPGTKAACTALPPVTTPVAPGQMTLHGMPTVHASTSGTSELAFTGLPVWPVWLAFGLVTAGLGLQLLRRRA